ncbi:S8 family peptidase, partial [Streptomyces chryseus]
MGPGPWAYRFQDNAGEGVAVYVLDTGIDTANPDFEGRAVWLRNFTGDGSDKDCNGRGTHVAGTVGGKTYGVAKKAVLIAVKVARCDGSAAATSDLIASIDSVVKDKRGTKGNVILFGSSQPKNNALNQAVQKAHQSGFVVVVPAGDGHHDACNVSPASSPNALTVGATTQDDEFLPASNHGRCVDVLGPGENTVSAWTGGPGTTRTQSGTAPAAAHAAGIAAAFLSQGTLTSPQAQAQIKSKGTKNAVTG